MKLKNNKAYTLKDYANRQVNLLPDDFHAKKSIKFQGLIIVLIFLVSVVAFGYYEFGLYVETQDVNDEILFKRLQTQVKKNEFDNQNKLIAIGARIQSKASVLGYIYSTNRSITDIISSFESTLNNEVFISGLSVNSNNLLSINATSTSHEAISSFINELKRLKTPENQHYFDKVFTSSISRNEDEDGMVTYKFQISCEFEGGINYEVE